MLKIKATTFYAENRRALKVVIGDVCWRFYWNPPEPDLPHLWIDWMNYYTKYTPGNAVEFHATVTPGKKPHASCEWLERGDFGGFRDIDRAKRLEYPRANWDDLLTIARFVAAGRCDKHLVAGWIEDNAPEPWCLLVSPMQVEAIQTLCPAPLSPPREQPVPPAKYECHTDPGSAIAVPGMDV